MSDRPAFRHSESPDNRDADTLIGSVIAESRLFSDVSYIKPMDFQARGHQLIWSAITATLRSGGLLTPQSLAALDPNLDPDELLHVARQAPHNPEACRMAARRISDLRRAAEAADILSKAATDI